MRKSLKKKIQRIIDKKFLCDWEFVIDVIANELEQEEYEPNTSEICQMVEIEKLKRKAKLWGVHHINKIRNVRTQ